MRAHKRTLVALDAFINLPFRHIDRNAPLLIGSGAGGEGAVFHMGFRKGANRQIIAFQPGHGSLNVPDVFRLVRVLLRCFFANICPHFGYIDLFQCVDTLVHSFIVHVHNLLAFSAIIGHNGLFQVFYRVIQRNNLCQLEESRLHYHIDTVAQTDFGSDLYGINHVEVQILLSNGLLYRCGKLFLQLTFRPGTVQDKDAALLDPCQDIGLIQERLVVAGDIICSRYQIGRFNRLLAEPQMGYRGAAGFLAVVGEIALRIQIGMVANDLDGRFVGAYGAVGTQTPEFAADGSFRCGVDLLRLRQGVMGYIIIDADGKAVHGLCLLQIAIYGKNLRRRGVL